MKQGMNCWRTASISLWLLSTDCWELLIGAQSGTDVRKIQNQRTMIFVKKSLKISSAKCRPFVIIIYSCKKTQFRTMIQTSKHMHKKWNDMRRLKHPRPKNYKKAQWAHGWIQENIILWSADLNSKHSCLLRPQTLIFASMFEHNILK